MDFPLLKIAFHVGFHEANYASRPNVFSCVLNVHKSVVAGKFTGLSFKQLTSHRMTINKTEKKVFAAELLNQS